MISQPAGINQTQTAARTAAVRSVYRPCVTADPEPDQPPLFSDARMQPLCLLQVVTGIRLRWLSPRAISNLFLASDIFCFLIQSSGAGIMTSDYNMGINLLLAGLALQLGFFVLFVILALHVPRIYITIYNASDMSKACSAAATAGAAVAHSPVADPGSITLFRVLYGTMALLGIQERVQVCGVCSAGL
jgi:hypothetical protein